MTFYMSPGTPDGRRKGGLISQKRRRERPEHYRALGCNMPKNYVFPRKSVHLAEFVGVILGDGGLGSMQLHITLNSMVDKDYLYYLIGQIKTMFGQEPGIYKRKDSNANVIVMGGINLIAFLCGLGLKIGNKVCQQVDVPEWIKKNREYAKFCLRGLMDTDGGVFVHKYEAGGRNYKYLKLSFTNKSTPLLNFVYEILCLYGFHPKYSGGNRVWLYSQFEVRRYLEVIGSSNKRLLRRLEV